MLGGASDDFVGCDTLLNLSYAYNGDDEDAQYGFQVPTVGFKLVQGPIVEGDINDEALFDDKYLMGFKNLPMTSALRLLKNSNSSFDDPDLGDYEEGSLRMYNFMQGLDLNANQIVDPITGKPTKFSVPGDPVLKEGWIENKYDRWPGDRRFIMTSGPFQMAAGDTQEVIIAAIATDKFKNIHWLKYYASLIPDNVNDIPKNLPNLPDPPHPTLNYYESIDGIHISWEEDDNIDLIENYDSNGYSFQGYNIYQFHSSNGFGKNIIKVATFDIVDNITTITGKILNDAGNPIDGILHSGSDSGIKRKLLISKDYATNKDLIKGKNYRFGISTYLYNNSNSILVNNSESHLETIDVEYIKNLAGINFGDTLEVENKDENGAIITPIVINPAELTGLDYTVIFDTLHPDAGGVMNVWNLDRSDGVRVLENQISLLYPEDSPTIDGFKLKVTYKNQIKSFSRIANGNETFDIPDAAAAPWQGFPIPLDADGNPTRPNSTNAIGGAYWLIHTGDNGQRSSYHSFLERSFRNDNFVRFHPYDWEMRFTDRGSWALRWYEDKHLVKVPFELWNIGIKTPDDPSDDFRLIPYFMSNGSIGNPQTDTNGLTFQLDPIDHSGSGNNNDPFTPWIYWIIPNEHINNSPGTIGYDNYINQIDTTVIGIKNNTEFQGGIEVIAHMVLVSWNGDDLTDGEVSPETQMVPETGTIYRIESNRLLEPGVDNFTFNTKLIKNSIIPDDYLLTQNYPNPFNNSTRLRYSFPNDGFVNISVYNILGQKVSELVNREILAGNYEIVFNTHSLASGVYIYRMEADKFVQSKKMLLLK